MCCGEHCRQARLGARQSHCLCGRRLGLVGTVDRLQVSGPSEARSEADTRLQQPPAAQQWRPLRRAQHRNHAGLFTVYSRPLVAVVRVERLRFGLYPDAAPVLHRRARHPVGFVLDVGGGRPGGQFVVQWRWKWCRRKVRHQLRWQEPPVGQVHRWGVQLQCARLQLDHLRRPGPGSGHLYRHRCRSDPDRPPQEDHPRVQPCSIRNAIGVLPDREQEANPFSARFDAEYGGHKLRVSPDAAASSFWWPGRAAGSSAAATVTATPRTAAAFAAAAAGVTAASQRSAFAQESNPVPTVQLRASLRCAAPVQ
uniref:(northern house mosquito) hypothetical protein n=1 Tax=Culex pipiens TaxID=7175 RepID=A0A8D8IUE5_CULPI